MDSRTAGTRSERVEPPERFQSLGDRLARSARRLAARASPRSAWQHAATPLFARVAHLPANHKRFRRMDPARLRPLRAEGQAEHAGAGPLARPRGFPPEPLLRERLRELVGPGLHSLRLHVDARADAIARGHRADAIAIGPDVHFRDGQFRPHEDRGFALLAHEAAHVARWSRPGASVARATAPGVAREEHEATRVESLALASRRQAVPATAAPAPDRSATPLPATAGSTAQRPMAAASDRPDLPDPAAALTGPDIDVLRQTLYRDLLSDIRTEFERGG